MKIRNDFVSNSSSSSFLVKVWDSWDKRFLTTDEEVKKLRDFGFKWTRENNSMRLLLKDFNDYIKEDKKYKIALGYICTCNQHEILYFLVSNNITFRASCQYGNETWMYDKDSKVIYEFQNFGHYSESRSFSKRFCDRVKADKKHDKNKWLQKMKEEIDDIEQHEIEMLKLEEKIEKIEKKRCYLCGRFAKDPIIVKFHSNGITPNEVKCCKKCFKKKKQISAKIVRES